MKISNKQSVQEKWDEVNCLNYKLPKYKKSVVVAKVVGEHGEVQTEDCERIYYIQKGNGYFIVNGQKINVKKGDVLAIKPNTNYNYFGSKTYPLEVVLFMELWDN